MRLKKKSLRSHVHLAPFPRVAAKVAQEVLVGVIDSLIRRCPQPKVDLLLGWEDGQMHWERVRSKELLDSESAAPTVGVYRGHA